MVPQSPQAALDWYVTMHGNLLVRAGWRPGVGAKTHVPYPDELSGPPPIELQPDDAPADAGPEASWRHQVSMITHDAERFAGHVFERGRDGMLMTSRLSITNAGTDREIIHRHLVSPGCSWTKRVQAAQGWNDTGSRAW